MRIAGLSAGDVPLPNIGLVPDGFRQTGPVNVIDLSTQTAALSTSTPANPNSGDTWVDAAGIARAVYLAGQGWTPRTPLSSELAAGSASTASGSGLPDTIGGVKTTYVLIGGAALLLLLFMSGGGRR